MKNGKKTGEASGPKWLLWVKDPLFWMRLILGSVFIFASMDKIIHPQAFARAIYNYQILPDSLINLTALILPWLELLAGLCLVSGVWLPGAVTLVTSLLVIFWSALLFNMVRGLDIQCGCFGTDADGSPAIIWYLMRDTLFLVLGVYLFWNVVVPHGRCIPTKRSTSHDIFATQGTDDAGRTV